MTQNQTSLILNNLVEHKIPLGSKTQPEHSARFNANAQSKFLTIGPGKGNTKNLLQIHNVKENLTHPHIYHFYRDQPNMYTFKISLRISPLKSALKQIS